MSTPVTAPQPLIDDIEAGRCLPFIGAGMSLNARLPEGRVMPDWKGLTTALARMAGAADDPDASGPAVASRFERRFGRVQLVEAVRRALHADHCRPGEAHGALPDLPVDTIYTTNFDLLIEDAFADASKPFRSLVGELQMPFHGGRHSTNVVKMHGDLRHEEHIVVTTEDYEGFLDKYPVVATHLSAQLITKTPLFIGYSLTDPDFRAIRDVVRSRLGRFERMAYVVAFDTPPADIERQLDDRVHVISLPSASGPSLDAVLAAFLRDIAARVDADANRRLRAARPDAFEDVAPGILADTVKAPDAAQLLTSSSSLCVVLAARTPYGERTLGEVVRPVAEQLGLTVVRADDVHAGDEPASEQVRAAIQQARLCVADLTGRSKSVVYETTVALELRKPTVLIARDAADVPAALAARYVVLYDPLGLERDAVAAQAALARAAQAALESETLAEARALVEAGAYRAAVATLGVQLEHTLHRLDDAAPTPTLEAAPSADRRGLARRRSLRTTVSALASRGVIDRATADSLLRVIDLRNRAVHDLAGVDAVDARFALDAVSAFAEAHRSI